MKHDNFEMITVLMEDRAELVKDLKKAQRLTEEM